MKKRSFLMAGFLVLSSLAATQVARAQEPLVVNIPFAFGRFPTSRSTPTGLIPRRMFTSMDLGGT